VEPVSNGFVVAGGELVRRRSAVDEGGEFIFSPVTSCVNEPGAFDFSLRLCYSVNGHKLSLWIVWKWRVSELASLALCWLCVFRQAFQDSFPEASEIGVVVRIQARFLTESLDHIPVRQLEGEERQLCSQLSGQPHDHPTLISSAVSSIWIT
jgi:hypothetical protein